jgi:hypothetical protein
MAMISHSGLQLCANPERHDRSSRKQSGRTQGDRTAVGYAVWPSSRDALQATSLF